MLFPMGPQNQVQFQFQHSSPPRRSSSNNLTAARQLIGRHVKINRGGPDSVEGVLLAVNGNVLVLNSKGTIIYVNGTHVKSITEGKSGGKSGGKSAGQNGGSSGGHAGRSMGSTGTGPAIINASTINGVLAAMHQQFIQINRGGPEKLEGFLAQTNNDFVLIIVGREFVRVPIFHIKTVNLLGKSGGNKNNNKNNNNRNQQSSGGSSGNRHSSGNQNRSSSGGRNRTSGNRKNRNRTSGGNRGR